VDAYAKRVKYLKVKLNVQVQSEKTDEEKYALLDIADEFLNPD